MRPMALWGRVNAREGFALAASCPGDSPTVLTHPSYLLRLNCGERRSFRGGRRR